MNVLQLILFIAFLIIVVFWRRLWMFVDRSLDALHWIGRGRRTSAHHSWWVACYWLAHGRWPSTQEYKDHSRNHAERDL
jgi:uncharacterized protein HemY